MQHHVVMTDDMLVFSSVREWKEEKEKKTETEAVIQRRDRDIITNKTIV